jgi:hypothetical protein
MNNNNTTRRTVMQQSVCILKVAGVFARFRRAWRNVIIGGLLAIAANGGRADDLPFTAVWSNIPDLVTSTNNYSGCDFKGKLADGRLIFVAAQPGGSVYRILLFDPQSNSWQWKAQLPAYNYTVFPLSDGRCLVVKNDDNGFGLPTYIYDPATDVLTRKADQNLIGGNYLSDFTYAELPNQEVYVFGSAQPGDTKHFGGAIYNLTNNTWRLGPNGPGQYTTLSSPDHSRVRWPDGSVTVLCPGHENYSVVRTLTFDPVLMAFTGGDGEAPAYTTEVTEDIRSCIRGSSAYYSFTTPYWGGSYYTPIRNTNGMNRIYSVDRSTGKLLLLHTRAPAGYMSFFFAAGRDWICRAYSDSALCGGEVYDSLTSQWLSLPQGPANPIYVPTLTNRGYSYFMEAITLSDGFLLVGRTSLRGGPDAGILRAVRLRVSSPTMPPQVSPVLPASLTLDEGTSTNLAYSVIGDFPTGGVDVVVEWLSGSGDVCVVDGAAQHVTSSGDPTTARIGALVDADAANDQAVIRLRVVQPGGGADPNARTIAVTVADRDTTLTILAGSGGTVAPAGALVVTKGVPTAVSATPTGGCSFVSWSVASGTPTIAFTNAAVTTVTIGAPATIQANFRAADGNRGPVITSAASASPNPVILPAGATVSVAATDPDSDALTYAWSQVSGAGAATFAAPTTASGGVTFSAPGSYGLQVRVMDSHGAVVNSLVTVTVSLDFDIRADVNHDGAVNALDAQIIIKNFGKTTP